MDRSEIACQERHILCSAYDEPFNTSGAPRRTARATVVCLFSVVSLGLLASDITLNRRTPRERCTPRCSISEPQFSRDAVRQAWARIEPVLSQDSFKCITGHFTFRANAHDVICSHLPRQWPLPEPSSSSLRMTLSRDPLADLLRNPNHIPQYPPRHEWQRCSSSSIFLPFHST